MGGIRELRGRIKSVGNIRQITRAMEMVASTKLRRFQDRALASRPYSQEITALVQHLASVLGEEVARRPLFQAGAGKAVAVLLVSSDRGLCGAYNSNLFKALELWLRGLSAGTDVRYFVYGKKGYQYLNARKRKVERLFVEPVLEQIDYRGAARAAKDLTDVFLSGEYREVRLLSTAFESMVRYVPRWIDFLPIQASALGVGEKSGGSDMILEPDPATIFDRLVPRYLETRVYNALVEAITSEYASKRASMKNATEAAKDMQLALKLVYNRKRQETITKELLDIVGGAEALR
ncbi:MAG: ATP synthase F1 subunit gamma [Planctomycetes bacterium]|nr:ATP synthase F1 subunit gamma [Planctomycetota bacterium]